MELPLRPAKRLHVDLAKISCALQGVDRSSPRNEHGSAFNESRECFRRDLRHRVISLDTCTQCFTANARARPRGCERRRAHLCGDVDHIRQLQSFCSCAAGQRTHSGSSIFENSGTESALDSFAVPWRKHFRARAARQILIHWVIPLFAGGDASAFFASPIQCAPNANRFGFVGRICPF